MAQGISDRLSPYRFSESGLSQRPVESLGAWKPLFWSWENDRRCLLGPII